MGTERSHELPSASQSPRKASSVSQSKSKGVGTRGADAVIPGRRQELSPSSISETGKRQILPRPSPQTPRDQMMPTHPGEGSLLSLPIQMLISSRNTLTDTPQRQCAIRAPHGQSS